MWHDAEKSLADILEVATSEFADKGLAGACIDEIAAAARTVAAPFGPAVGLTGRVVQRLPGAALVSARAKRIFSEPGRNPDDAIRFAGAGAR